MSKIARNRTNAKKINKFLYMFKLKTKHHLTFRLQSSRRSIHIYIERDRVRQRETEREREREREHTSKQTLVVLIAYALPVVIAEKLCDIYYEWFTYVTKYFVNIAKR